MPSLKKKAISLYLRTGCQRQLLLNLYGDAERRDLGMPPRQTARAGAGYAGQLGYDWQDQKVSELDAVFGAEHVHVNPKREGKRPGTLELCDVLPAVEPYEFVVEGRYDPDTDTFKEAVGIGALRDRHGGRLGVGNAFPDLVQVLPPMSERPAWEVEEEGKEPTGLGLEVLPSGDVRPLAEDDERLRLRVIDIKLAAEPGAHYFAEVVYYSMALAAVARRARAHRPVRRRGGAGGLAGLLRGVGASESASVAAGRGGSRRRRSWRGRWRTTSRWPRSTSSRRG